MRASLGLAGRILALASSASTPLLCQQPEKVGAEMCVTCHEDKAKWVAKSPHKDCESCHGPGSKHAESADKSAIRLPASLNCLACHRGQPSQAGRIQGAHARNQVGCASCHSIHQTKPKAELRAQCGACHVTTVAEFSRPFRHKVPEGVMSCVDCHNPHGQPLSRVVKPTFNEPGCLKCHGDKRGPFVYEHAPVRLEGCSACHEPHGSVNPRLLNRHEARVQCLECHSGASFTRTQLGGAPPAFHDLRSQRFQNCTGCHLKVHGSQVSRDLLR